MLSAKEFSEIRKTHNYPQKTEINMLFAYITQKQGNLFIRKLRYEMLKTCSKELYLINCLFRRKKRSCTTKKSNFLIIYQLQNVRKKLLKQTYMRQRAKAQVPKLECAQFCVQHTTGTSSNTATRYYTRKAGRTE